MRRAITTMFRHAIVLLALATVGCETIPSDSYGISRIRFHGAEDLDAEALRACLATRERDAFQIDLGTSSELTCDRPPFDGGRASLRFFSWPWTDWPTYDQAVFERDLDRVERWYRARGYYDARVEDVRFRPEAARDSDELPEVGDVGCERRGGDEGCTLEIDVTVSEGEFVRVRRVDVHGHENLRPSLRSTIREAVELSEGERFDEALHDSTKEAMVTALREAGHACATVRATVALDPEQRIADVDYYVRAGGISRFRRVVVEVSGEARRVPIETIRAAAGVRRGEKFSPSAIARAQRDVYALQAFSSVEVEAVPAREEGAAEGNEPDECTGEVDVVVRVTPGRRFRYGVGAGLDSGFNTVQPVGTSTAPRQWNVHFLGRFEDRNFLGGLRRLRIEDRPKIIFPAPFPNPGDEISPGNEVTVEFHQPAFIERATTLNASMRHDFGLDAIYAERRHFVDGHIDVQRRFRDGHFAALVGFTSTAFLPTEADSIVAPYAITFLTQNFVMDYRDNATRPRRGIWAQVNLQQAGLGGLIGSDSLMSWRYIRVEPEVRGYIPLPYRFTIAGRFRVGYMAMLDRYGDQARDPVSYLLGPSAYRLRAGGPNSHRGYSASALGDVADGFRTIDGGLAKWEASLEIRSLITEDFGATFFADFGDVNRAARFRFEQPHTAMGFGIRYYTVVGPIRLDFGFLVRRLAVFGDAVNLTEQSSIIGNSRARGAITLTIGDAF